MLCCGFTLMMTRPAKCEVKKKKNIKDFGSLIVTPMHRQVKWQES